MLYIGRIEKLLVGQGRILLCTHIHTHWSIPQPAAVLGVCRFEGNLVWGFSYGAVEADRDWCYLFHYILAEETCWPFRSAADYLFTGREKYVSHYEHWRLIAAFLLQRSVSDWPVAEIIASLVVWGELVLIHRLVKSGCPHQGPALSSVSGSSGHRFILHCICKCAPQYFLSLVGAKITVIIEWKVGLSFS